MRSIELGGTLEVILSTSLIFLTKMEKPEKVNSSFQPPESLLFDRAAGGGGGYLIIFLLSHDKGVIVLISVSLVPS